MNSYIHTYIYIYVYIYIYIYIYMHMCMVNLYIRISLLGPLGRSRGRPRTNFEEPPPPYFRAQLQGESFRLKTTRRLNFRVSALFYEKF